ncbi:hypothetical protein CK203_085117 [Vitis vinifera]|uniref:Uncharacterized protein n=1 Tax=Vitis vinifera TaxID=29760 RepID=A0A438DUY5_VITVI|nr:hypothetical protein CK203_085117 [Vitis vinifera]
MLRPYVPDDPRSCQMDECVVLNQYRWWQGHHHPTGGLTEIVIGDAAVRDRGGGTWVMAGCCDNVPDRRSGHVYSNGGDPDDMRATCHHEMRGTCSQEEGSLHWPLTKHM